MVSFRSPRSASCSSCSRSCCSPSTYVADDRSCAAPSAAASRRPAGANPRHVGAGRNRPAATCTPGAPRAALSDLSLDRLPAVGTPAPVALALLGRIIASSFRSSAPSGGSVPVLLLHFDRPSMPRDLLIAIVVYQRIETTLFSPASRPARCSCTRRWRSGGAGCAAVLGGVGAILALPAAAMIQALSGEWGTGTRIIRRSRDVHHHHVFDGGRRSQEGAPVTGGPGFSAHGAPDRPGVAPIAVTERSGVVESIHHGADRCPRP